MREIADRQAATPGGTSDEDAPPFETHMKAIAHARYVMRHVMQILDRQAVEHGLQPLQHQALLQVYGAGQPLPVSRLGERLDIAPALASRITGQLEKMHLVERTRVADDRRIIAVGASELGVARLRDIDAAVQRRINAFHEELDTEGKYGALAVFAFYVGLDGDDSLHSLLQSSGAPLH